MIIQYNDQAIFVGSGGSQWSEGQPTLVLQHGAALNRTVWVLLGRYFARHGYNVVIPDLPAHGASEGQALPSIEANATWLNGLVEHLALSHPIKTDGLIYCGHSMGALIVLEAASRQPEKIAKLVLLGSAVPMAVGDALLNAARDNDHAAIDMINMYGHAFASRIGNNPVSGISAYNTMEALLEQADDGVLFADMNACNEYKNGETAARSIAGIVKSTVISGDADFMTPTKLGAKLAKTLEGDFTLLKDCGHMMMSEQPEATLLALKKALNLGT